MSHPTSGYIAAATNAATSITAPAGAPVHPQVEAVSLNPLHDFSKHPQPAIRLLAGLGVESDAHCGSTTQHLYRKRQDATQSNLCQVHLFARERLDELSAAGFPVEPGAIGENILTEGLDLHALPRHTLLHLGPEAVLEITGLRTPCSQIDAFRPGLQQHCWGPREPGGKRTRRAGIMAIVRSGGLVHPADAIQIVLPPPPHQPLPPVG